MRLYLSGLLVLLIGVGCSPRQESPSTGTASGGPGEVIVYCAQDQLYGEPILREFEKRTGIRVRASWDAEATKTVGLVNKILAERDHPRCDVFWNNEILHTIRLQKEGLLAPYISPSREGIPLQFYDPEGHWTGIGARARVILYNKNLVSEEEVPRSLFALADPKWKGRCTLALPLFGTTLTHAVALFQKLGEEKAREFFDAVAENAEIAPQGNRHVKDLVANGQMAWGLTDTDDANVALRDGKPVAVIFPDQEEGQIGTYMIPNTLMLIQGGPNPENGKRLVDYLVSQEVEERLARGPSAQLPLHRSAILPPAYPEMASLRPMEVDYQKLAEGMAPIHEYLRDRFMR